MAKKKPIVSKYGQWKYPGQETIIPDANGRITMQGVPYPVFGIDDQGNQQMMMPGQEYKFPGNSVYEFPMPTTNTMDRGFDRGSGKSTGVAQPKELTKEQRALDDWQRLTSNGSSTFEKRIPAPDDKTYQQLLSRSQGGPSSSDKGMFLGHFTYRDGGLVRMDPGGPTKKQAATDNNDPKKTDNSQPYMYLDQKTNTWLRPPENRDQNQMIDWSVNPPAFSTRTINIQGGKKVSPEEAAKAKEYYRQKALKTPEGLEEERQRLMQEFVDQQNANKSELQKSFGNLSLDNPATRDAARNYAEYKLGESNPLNAFDKLSTGRDTPGTKDYYRPNEATYSFGIPAAAVMAPIAAEAAVAAAPYIGEGFQALRTAAKPMGQAWNTTLNAPRFGNNALTLGNAFKTLGAYDLSHKYIPNTIEDAQMYNKTGDVKYLEDGAYNLGKSLLEIGASTGPLMSEVSAAKKPVSLVDDARKTADVDKDINSRALSGIKTFKNTLGYIQKDGGDISLPNLKRVKIKSLPNNWKTQ